MSHFVGRACRCLLISLAFTFMLELAFYCGTHADFRGFSFTTIVPQALKNGCIFGALFLFPTLLLKKDSSVPVIPLIALVLLFPLYAMQNHPGITIRVFDWMNSFDDQTLFNLDSNPYLHGPFQPVQKEHYNVDVTQGIISGILPADLEGLFLRIGPNPTTERFSHGYHLFDGDGMLHSLRIRDKQVFYSNAFVRTPTYQTIKRYGSPFFPVLGELASPLGLIKMLFSKHFVLPSLQLKEIETGTANTAMYYYDKKIYIGYEASLPFLIHWNGESQEHETKKNESNDSFESVGYADFKNVNNSSSSSSSSSSLLALDFPVIAHPKVDPRHKNHLYHLGYSADPMLPALKYGKVVDSKLVTYFPIHLPTHPMIHDMMITDHYALVFDSSIIYDSKDIFFKGKMFTFDEKKPLRIGLIHKDKATSEEDIIWINNEKNESFGMFHPCNAWEKTIVNAQGETEVVEITLFMPMTRSWNGFSQTDAKDTLRNPFQLKEIHIHLPTRTMTIEPFPAIGDADITDGQDDKYQVIKKNSDLERLVEFPSVHPFYFSRESEFGFMLQLSPVHGHFHKILKYNFLDPLKKGIIGSIRLPREDQIILNEGVLIPKKYLHHVDETGAVIPPKGDATYMAVFVRSLSLGDLTDSERVKGSKSTSEWIVYDLETMSSEPVVRLQLPEDISIPFGFHGIWLDEQSLQEHLGNVDSVDELAKYLNVPEAAN
jgi:carotenoid cleavage dioxygenase-like enzyme